jgi:hypothetical protein
MNSYFDQDISFTLEKMVNNLYSELFPPLSNSAPGTTTSNRKIDPTSIISKLAENICEEMGNPRGVSEQWAEMSGADINDTVFDCYHAPCSTSTTEDGNPLSQMCLLMYRIDIMHACSFFSVQFISHHTR